MDIHSHTCILKYVCMKEKHWVEGREKKKGVGRGREEMRKEI
jgi:predicted transcriptional regulator